MARARWRRGPASRTRRGSSPPRPRGYPRQGCRIRPGPGRAPGDTEYCARRRGSAPRDTLLRRWPRAARRQTRLSHAGLPHDARHLAVPRLDLREQIEERGQLAGASDEATEPAPALIQTRAARPGTEERVHDNRLGFSADGDRPAGLEPGVAFHEPRGGVADQDDPRLGELLQPRGQVRGVAHRGVVHAQVVADGAHHHEAGVRAHPELEGYLLAGVEPQRPFRKRAPDPDRGQHRAPRVILVRDRRAEERHEAVAQELVDGALEAVDLAERPLEEGAEQRVHAVGPELLGQYGGADQIAEQHRDRLALAFERAARGQDLLGEVLWRIGFGSPGLDLRANRLPTLQAELRRSGQLGSTLRAGQCQTCPAFQAELGVLGIVVLAPETLHYCALPADRSRDRSDRWRELMLADRKGSRSGLVPLRVTKVTGVSDFLAVTHAMT